MAGRVLSGAILWLALGAATPVVAQAQDTRVRILDDQGRPVAFAEVEVSTPDARHAALTDAEGYVTIPFQMSVEPALTQINVVALDGRTAEAPLAEVLASASTLVVGDDASSLGEIVVVGRRISRSYAPQVTTQLSILVDPAARADPLLAVDSAGYSTNTSGSADLELRGNRSGINRVYFNDVPLYETVRGSNVDRTTRGFSVFNIGMVGEIEVYPSNPPAYLAGSAGGALRVLPGETATPARSALLSTAAAAYNQTFARPDRPDSFLKVFLSGTDMAASLAVNPVLEDTIDDYRSLSGGATGRLTTANGGTVDVYAQLDQETGSYPLSLFGYQNLFGSDRERASAVVSTSVPVKDLWATLNVSATSVTGEERYGALQANHDNAYAFASLDLAGRTAGSLDFRFGLDAEWIGQESEGFGPEVYYAYGDTASAAPLDASQSLRDITAYGFVSRAFGRLSVHAGARRTISSSLEPETALQMGLAYVSEDGSRKTIVSGGRYFGADILASANFGPIARVTSEQIALDQSWRTEAAILGLGLYAINERSRGRETRTRGVEVTAKVDVTENLSATMALASVSQEVRLPGYAYPGDADLDFIAKSTVRYRLYEASSLNLFVVGRSGARTTLITGGEPDSKGRIAPVFSQDQNGDRLPWYWSIDLSYITFAEWFPTPSKPLLFVSANNLTGRENVSGYEYADDFTRRIERPYPGRVITVGTVWNF